MGNKRQRGPQSGPKKYVKKPKRSKAYWQNRPTTSVAPVPHDDTESDSGSSDGEVIETDYDKLLTAFGAKKEFGSDEEDSGEDSEAGDEELIEEDQNSVQDDESDAEGDEEQSEVENESDIENSDVDGSNDNDENDAESDEENIPDEPTVEDIEEESNDDDDEKEEETIEDSNTKISADITGGPKDPFTARYELKIPDELMEAVKNRDMQPQSLKWKRLGRLAYFKPKWSPTSINSKSLLPLTDDNDDNTVTNPDVQAGQMELIEKEIEVMDISDGLENCFVKLQLVKNARTANARNLISETEAPLSPFQQELFSVFHSYRDFCFTERTHTNSEEIRFVYTLHALNHMLKTRTKIVNNNARINQIKEGKKKKQDNNLGNIRDQGLVRPKVLIVVPFKESARRIVDLMIRLLFGKDQGKSTIMKKGKFDDEFGTENDAVPGSGNKPDDFYRTFTGNIDDGFKVGIGVTKKALKLYSDFYSSDFLIASPLGLRMVLESDADFLSSIELLIMDQVDIFMMQNWDHVTFLFEKIHQRPAKSHGVDFSRVRLWALDEMSSFYRQTLLFSGTPMVELNAIFNRLCHNYLGKLCTTNPVKVGSISSVVLNDIPIVFHRAETSSVASSIDDRFNYFVQKVMPEYKKDMMFHTLIFVPSYFDYVRLRNWFNKSDLDFSEVCEYTKEKKIFKARDQFFHGEKHFLLYTERSHFYKRFTIKGVRHLIFYQLPQNSSFFPEICNFMQPAFLNRKGGSDGNMSCHVIYTKYDNQRLASVCSTSKAEFMMSATKNVHLFMPGNS